MTDRKKGASLPAHKNIFTRRRTDPTHSDIGGESKSKITGKGKCNIYYSLANDNSKPIFISEDRLCQTSAFFRSRLQHNRRENSDCNICQQPLSEHPNTPDPTPSNCLTPNCPICDPFLFEDLTLQPHLTCCITCDQTFHLPCIDLWRASPINLAAGDRCPWCRRPWTPPLSALFPTLDPKAVAAYFDFVSHGQTTLQAMRDNMLVQLIRCYEAGVRFQNKDFCVAVMEAVFRQCNNHSEIPRRKEIEMVYGAPVEFCALKMLVRGIWVQWSGLGMDCLRKEGAKMPQEFVHDLQDVGNAEPVCNWYEMPVRGLLEVRRVVPGLLDAVERDFEMVAVWWENEGEALV